METTNLLEAAIIKLICEERFLAEMVLNMKRYITTDIPTFGVNVTDSVNLYINPYAWASLSLAEQVDVLKHECRHVLNNHFVRFKELCPDLGKKQEEMNFFDMLKNQTEFTFCNYAGDYAINEFLPNLPKELTMFDKDGKALLEPEEYEDEKGNKVKNPNAGKPAKGKLLFVDDWRKHDPKIEKNQHMEYYHERLKQEAKKNGSKSKIQGFITVDDHSIWDQGSQDPEYVTEKVKNLVNKAAESAKGAGSNIDPRTEELIQALNHKAKDWRNDLKKFVAKTTELNKSPTRKKRNRRYGLANPGYKFDERLHLAFVVDSSGSMYSELLCQGWAELIKLSKMGVKITLIECDDKVHNVEEFNPKKLPVLNGRGGTSFIPAFKEVEKRDMDIDGMIYFTDGDSNDYNQCKKPNYPVLWAMPNGCKNKTSFGSETVIEINKKKA